MPVPESDWQSAGYSVSCLLYTSPALGRTVRAGLYKNLGDDPELSKGKRTKTASETKKTENKKTGVKRAETGKEYVGKCRKTDDAL